MATRGEKGPTTSLESRVSSPYATAGKLARLQCFPCRDLEKKKSSKSPNVATRGRKGAKHRSTRTRRSRRTASHGFFFSPMSTYTPPPRGFYGGEEGQPTTTLVPKARVFFFFSPTSVRKRPRRRATALQGRERADRGSLSTARSREIANRPTSRPL